MNCSMMNSTSVGPLGIDYVAFHTCTMDGSPIISMIILLLWLVWLFYLLGETADAYFSPTLSQICEKLHIPYDIAGVTLLAFGNGAADVFSSVSAFRSGAQDTAINALLGGGVFVTTVVVGCIILVSQVKVSKRVFFRDTIMYTTALGLLWALGQVGHITVQLALVFPIVYLTYVGIVMDLRHKMAAKVMSAFGHVENTSSSPEPGPELVALQEPLLLSISDDDDDDVSSSNTLIADDDDDASTEMPSDIMKNYFEPTAAALEEDVSSSRSSLAIRVQPNNNRTGHSKVKEGLYWSHMRWRQSMKRQMRERLGAHHPAVYRLLCVIGLPFSLARDLTIPILEPGSWSRIFAAGFPLTTPGFIYMVFFRHVFPSLDEALARHWLVVVSISTSVSTLVFFTVHRKKPPSSFWPSLGFLVLAFVSCMAWIELFASELVALLMALGSIYHISDSVLGFTVLAWGNSMADLITNVSVARTGFSSMAIAGCYGGPLFNLLIGLGMSMLMRAKDLDLLQSEPNGFTLKLDRHAIISLVTLVLTLGLTVVVMIRSNYHAPRAFGYILLLMYVVYTGMNLLDSQ